MGAKPGQEPGGLDVLDRSPNKLLSECRCCLLDRQLLTWGYKQIDASSSHPGMAVPSSSLFVMLQKTKTQGLLPCNVDKNQVCAFLQRMGRTNKAAVDPQEEQLGITGAAGGHQPGTAHHSRAMMQEMGLIWLNLSREKNPSDVLGIGGVPRGMGQREEVEVTLSPRHHLHDHSGEDSASPQAEPDPSLISLINAPWSALTEVEPRPNLHSFTRSGCI